MRKKSDEEFGFIITREILGVIKGKTLTEKELGRFVRYIFNDEVDSTGSDLMDAFAAPMREGFKKVNEKRMEDINAVRERKKAYMQRRNNDFIDGNGISIDNDRHLWTSMDAHKHPLTSKDDNGRQWKYKAKQSNIYNISPYNPPKGDEVADLMLDGDEVECFGSPRRVAARDDGEGGAARDDGKGGAARDDGEGVAKKDPPAIDTSEIAIAGYIGDTMADIQRTKAYQRMRVNPAKLKRCLAGIFKKKCGADAEMAKKLYFDILSGLEAWEPYWESQGWQYAPRKITTWLKDEKYLEPVRGGGDFGGGAGAVEESPGCRGGGVEIA